MTENRINRKQFIRNTAMGAMGIGALASLPGCANLFSGDKKYNVLFISVDDLRTDLNCYGAEHIHSPNIDKLAAEGLLFTRTYCQQAVCSPSRTSLLTGVRPENNGVLDLKTHFRDTIPDVVTLPEQFKKNGYHTRSFSKILHPGLDDPQSWSEPSWWSSFPDKYNYRVPEIDDMLMAEYAVFREENADRLAGMSETDQIEQFRKKHRGPSWGAPDVEDNMLTDGECADEVIKALKAAGDKPFFFAAGLRKPHLPWVAPKKYYDMYPMDEIVLADNPFMPEGAPEVAGTQWGELRKYRDIPKEGPVSNEKAIELTRAYYACVSYIDAQVGRIMSALDESGLRDSTVVILWGDHGYHLLDHGLWNKHTNYETSTRVPMIISVPGMKEKGKTTDALTEFVDIYPTLCDVAGVPTPAHVEGYSYKPLLQDADLSWKTAAFSLYPREVEGVGDVMGRAMRTDRYRYVEWTDENRKFLERELYDHNTDPKENTNIANRPENTELVAQLAEQLANGWRGALPR